MSDKKEIPAIKELCTKFYFWWHNSKGTNTYQGFDSFAETEEGKKLIAEAARYHQEPVVDEVVCKIGAFEHNKSIFHLGQCHSCYQKNVIDQKVETPLHEGKDAVAFAEWIRESKYSVNSLGDWFSYDIEEKPIPWPRVIYGL